MTAATVTPPPTDATGVEEMPETEAYEEILELEGEMGVFGYADETRIISALPTGLDVPGSG